MTGGKIIIARNQEALAKKGAEIFNSLSEQSINQHGRFIVALSGGATPQRMHALLAQKPLSSQIDWQKIQIFLSDERFVPREDSVSNFGTLHATLLQGITLPKENFHSVQTIDISPEEAAEEYRQEIQKVTGQIEPSFDAIWLGLGPDGHTASLFSGLYTPRDDESLILVVKNSPKPPPIRISFSMRLINNARNVVVMANGKEKALVIKQALEKNPDLNEFPGAMINPKSNNLFWLLDEEAASLLIKD